MNANADSELDTLRLLQTSIEVSHGSKNSQTSSDSPLCIIFMGLGVAKVHEESITEQLSNMPIVALDNVRTHPLILAHHVTPVFRVELRGELRRVHQVAEHHRELAAFGVGRRWDGGCDLDLSTRGVLGRRLGSAGRR